MRVLLTGASGQVGGRLLPLLSARHEVAAPGRSGLDLADPSSIRHAMRELKPELVVNAAAWTDVEGAENAPEAVAVNAVAPALLAAEAARLGAAVIHFSSDYVFDGTRRSGYRETDLPNPLNAYGRGKLAGDLGVLAAPTSSLVLRCGWIYDSRGRNFLRTILRLMAERPSLQVVADQHGAPTPAGVVAAAVARIVEMVAADRAVADRSVVNLACAGHTTWRDFAEEILALARAAGADLATRSIEPIPTSAYWGKAKRPLDTRLRTTVLRRRFGIRPPHWRVALGRLFAADGAILP